MSRFRRLAIVVSLTVCSGLVAPRLGATDYTFSIMPPEQLILTDGGFGTVNITSGTFNLTGLIGYSQANPNGVTLLDPLNAGDDITHNVQINSGIRMGLLEVDDEYQVLEYYGFFNSLQLAHPANFAGYLGSIGPGGVSDMTVFLPQNTTQPLRTQITSLNLATEADNFDRFVEVGLLNDPTIRVSPTLAGLPAGVETFTLSGDPSQGTPDWFLGIGGTTDPGGSSGGGGTATLTRLQAAMKIHGTFINSGCIPGSLCTATWTGGSGDYNTPASWDIGIVPYNGNFDGSTFNVVINSGSPQLLQDVDLVNLTVNGGELVIGGRIDVQATNGTIANAGTIRLADLPGGLSNETLGFAGGTTLTGGGEVVMQDATARLVLYSGSGGLVNVDNTIRGQGIIQSDVTNTGIIRAQGGTLQVSGSVTNASGLVQVDPLATLQVNTLTGGTIDVDAAGVILGTLVDVTNIDTITVTTAGLGINGTITNTGVITFENDTGTTTDEQLRLFGPVTLTGSGEVVMTSADASIVQWVGSADVTNVDNTIRGQGSINAPLHNQSLVRAEGGQLNLSQGGTNTGTMRAATGSTLTVGGLLNNTGGLIDIETGATLQPTGTIEGGTITAAAGSFVGGSGGGFKDLTLTGTHTVTTASLGIQGAITNTGTITFENNTGTSTDEQLRLFGSLTLDGGGEVVFNSVDSTIVQWVGSVDVTNIDNTIRGEGAIHAPLHNAGLVRSEGGNLNLSQGGSNTGTMRAATGSTLAIGAGLSNTGGLIDIEAGGTFSPNGTIEGGTVNGAAGSLIGGNGALKDLNTTGTLTIMVGGIGIDGVITNTGVITYENNTGTSTDEQLRLFGSASLQGGGEVILNSNDSTIVQWVGSGVLTNVDNTIRGTGTISPPVINQHVIRAEGGMLSLATTDNTAGTVQVATDGILNLTGELTGGILDVDAGGLVRGSQLVGVTNIDTLSVDPNTVVVRDAIINTGLITFLGDTGTSSNEILYINGTVNLSGGGEVVLVEQNDSYISDYSAGLLVNVDNTIRGTGVISVPVINQHVIRAEGGVLSLATTNNTGATVQVASDGVLTLSGELTGGTLDVAPGGIVRGTQLADVTNTGTLTVDSSTLVLRSSLINSGVVTFLGDTGTTANDILYINGTVNLTGGGEIVLLEANDSFISDYSSGLLVNVDNTIRGTGSIGVPVTNQSLIRAEGGQLSLATTNNTAGTVEVAADGILNMGGDLTGGILDVTAGGLVRGSQLVDVTNVGTLTVDNNSVVLRSSLINTGVVTFLGDTGTTANDILYINGTVNLTGGGEVVLVEENDSFISDYSSGLLVNVDNTIRGMGSIGVPVTNQSVIRAEGGTLSLSTTDNTAGTVQVAFDGVLTLNGELTGGTLDVDAGGIVGGTQLADVTNVDTLTVGGNPLVVRSSLINTGSVTFLGDTGTTANDILYLNGPVSLTGGGEVVLVEENDSFISDYSSGLLVNVDNTIRGTGSIGVAMSNESTIRPEGGAMNVNTVLNNESGGVIDIVAGGILRNGGTLTNKSGGLIQIAAGGELENNSTLINEAGASIIGNGTLDNNATFINNGFVSPGLSPGILTVEGNFEQGATGVLTIEIDGVTTPGVDFDQLPVSGNATLGGKLELVFGPGYTPSVGDRIEFMPVGGSVLGAFAEITQVVQPGTLGMAVVFNQTTGAIEIRGATRGDTDVDGDVDTADLTNAIIGFTGANVTGSNWSKGDFDGDGDTDTGDLTTAIINFTGAGGQAGNANVPDLVYDPATGNVVIDADGADVISFSLQAGPFSPADFSELPAGLTDNIASQIGWTSFNLFSGLTGTADLGAILPAGLNQAALEAALTTASYGLALSGGGGGGRLDIIIPEPASVMLIGLGAVVLVRRRRGRPEEGLS